jgi:hypothetical protein
MVDRRSTIKVKYRENANQNIATFSGFHRTLLLRSRITPAPFGPVHPTWRPWRVAAGRTRFFCDLAYPAS